MRSLQIVQFEDGWGFVGRIRFQMKVDQNNDDPLTPENETKLANFFDAFITAATADPFKVNVWKTKQAAINAATEAGHTVLEPLH
jgi:hypothetical protein